MANLTWRSERYRSSILFAVGGLLISALVMVGGPRLRGDGGAPAREVAADLDARLQELRVSVEARARTLAQLPSMESAVANRGPLVLPLTPEGLGFRAHSDEWIALGQVDNDASDRETTVWCVPPELAPHAQAMLKGTRARIVGKRLWLTTVVGVGASKPGGPTPGVLLHGQPIALEEAAQRLKHTGISAELVAPSGVLPLSVVPASEQRPETAIPVGGTGAVRLAVRLSPPPVGPWIALAIFVLFLWGGAAALAARRVDADAIPTAVSLPRVRLPPPEGSRPAASAALAARTGRGAPYDLVEVTTIIETPSMDGSEAAWTATADFRDLFSEFLDVRRRCGDVGEEPTLDQFARSLQQRRAAMIASRVARAVSFQIVFIDGHAVVRAKAVA